MQRISLLLSVLIVCLVTIAAAQTGAPMPDPELQKLHFMLGHWKYVCEYQATPLGPAGKNPGEVTYQMVLGGFYMQVHWVEKGTAGELQQIEMIGYDPAARNFTVVLFSNDESTSSATFTLKGNTLTSAGKLVSGGKQYLTRTTEIWGADWMSVTMKAELSTDGKTWMPWWEQNMTKVKLAAKR